MNEQFGAQHEAAQSPLRAAVATSGTLFGCLFAAQSGLLVLSPVLSHVAADLGVSAAAAGQLRAVSGGVAAAVALVLVVTRRRWELRGLLTLGLGLVAAATLGSAAAPTYWALAVMQVVLGGGLALVVAGGLAAAGRWAPDGRRATVLSWALVGQPSAWIIGMPLVGLLGAHSWRFAWFVPCAASLLALIGVALRERGSPEPAPTPARSLLRRRGVTRWAVSELLAYAGWAGILVFSGSLLIEAHGVSVASAGIALGGGAAAYVAGTFLARRFIERSARPMALVATPGMASAAVLLGAVRPSLSFSVAMFAVIAFFAGARMIATSAIGLDLAGVGPLQAMSLRAAAMQSGYLAGAVLGGIGLVLGGWPGLGGVLAVPLLLATAVLAMGSGRSATAGDRTRRSGSATALTKAGSR